MRTTPRLLLAAGILAGGTVPAPAAEKPAHPNIVLILSDDFGWGGVGCYGADPKHVRTPNMDRLAREGRRFTDACTPSSVCSPTRYAVLTGRYCWRTSLKRGVINIFDPMHIESSRLTIASLLKRKGYATAAVGKWHLGYGNARRLDYTKPLTPGPLDIGFDYHFAVPQNHGDMTGVYVENRKVAGLRSTTLKPMGNCFYGRPFIGLDAPQRVDEEVTDVLTEKAAAWMDTVKPNRPFFLYFTPVAVHEPVTPSAETKGKSGCGPYGDFIQDLDRSVGGILDAIDRKGVAGNTLVIFTSDNGAVVTSQGDRPWAKAWAAGLRAAGPWRGRKHSIFEGGFRVPFIARWPGRIPAGTVCDETISLVDLLATTAAIVKEPLPPPSEGAEDSFNVLPALLGERIDKPLRPDLIEHSADGNFAIRQGPWKWIEGKPHPQTKPGTLRARRAEFKEQLYNLKEDAAETRDVLQQNTALAHQLKERLETCRKRGHTRR